MPAMSNPVPFHSEAFSLEVAHRLGQLMSERGTPAHQQVSLLTQLCGLSPSQARRKLQGAHWSFAEVLAVAHHCETSVDALFPELSAAAGNPDLISELPTTSWLEVDVRLGAFKGNGEARLGMRVGGPVDAGTLIAVQEEAGWRVGTLDDLGENFRPDQQFLVDELLIHAPQSQLKRIAILDDDASLASSLAEWFNEAGFAAIIVAYLGRLHALGIVLASAPMSPRPSTAVPLVTTPTRLPRLVYLNAALGSLTISSQGAATPGE